MIAAVLATVLAATNPGVGPAPSAGPAAEAAAQLPAGWHADFGAPVAWHDTTLWIYADAFTRIGSDMQPDAQSVITRQAVTTGSGAFLVNLLPSPASGTNYWISDAIELTDGSLLVVALEERDRFDLDPPYNFELVDTDAFIVNDPTSQWSWQYAAKQAKLDDGPWGDDAVYFSDAGQDPLVFARDPWTKRTVAYHFDPANPFEWGDPITTHFPASDGAFAPVHTADGWIGIAFHVWHEVEYWRADRLDGTWTLDHVEHTVLETHDHQLNVVDGYVLHRSNNLDGDRRPHYELLPS